MLNKTDKDKLLILSTLLAFIAFVFILFHATRLIPIYCVIIIFLVVTFVCYGVISAKYLKLYGCYSAVHAWLPIFNCINTFPTPVALSLLVSIVLSVLCAIFSALPAEILLKFMSERSAMWYYDRATVVLLISLIITSLVISVGYCCIYRDVRRMLYSATGLARPKAELFNYPLMFIPLVSTMGYVSIISQLNHLEKFNYKEGEQSSSEDTKFNEVVK